MTHITQPDSASGHDAARCPQCHLPVAPSSRFCPACGHATAAEQAPQFGVADAAADLPADFAGRLDPGSPQAGATGPDPSAAEVAPRTLSRDGRRLLIGLGVLGAVTIGLIALTSGPTPQTLEVTQTVTGDTSYYYDSGNCSDGLTGYWDVSDGTSVTVTGDDGEQLGSGTLYTDTPSGSYYCEYSATIDDIPDNHDSYTVTVGDGDRGDFTYTSEELEDSGWSVGFTLGE